MPSPQGSPKHLFNGGKNGRVVSVMFEAVVALAEVRDFERDEAGGVFRLVECA